MFCALLHKYKSNKTSAIIASAIGTARIPTHGSCRPFVLIVVALFFVLIVAVVATTFYTKFKEKELRYFEKRRFKEISQILNISESNAKVRIHRIVAKIKRSL